MQVARSATTKEDNLFGVCAALGEDFGFNPLYLRLTLAVLLLWNPWAVLGAYAGAGVVVAFSRWLFPRARPRAADQERAADDEAVEMAYAA